MTTQTLDFEALAQVMGRAAPQAPDRAPRAASAPVGERSLPALPGIVADPETMRAAQSERAFLAAAADPAPGTCANCGGVGLVFLRTIVAGPFRSPPGSMSHASTWLDDGPEGAGWYLVDTVSRPCPVCSAGAAARQGAVSRLREACGLKPAELAFRMDFVERLARRLNRPDLLDGKREALDLMGRWAAALPNASGLAFLYGPPGVGKSGLAMAYVAAAVNLAVPAAYVTVPDLIKARRATMSGAPDPLPGLLRATVLVLDEVDRVGTEWERHELFTVLDARARARFSAATVLISNRTPDELSADGFGYLVSRLLLGEVAAMGGADLRALVR